MKCLSKKLDFTYETGKYIIAWLESSFDDLLVCQGHPGKETSIGSCGRFHWQQFGNSAWARTQIMHRSRGSLDSWEHIHQCFQKYSCEKEIKWGNNVKVFVDFCNPKENLFV